MKNSRRINVVIMTILLPFLSSVALSQIILGGSQVVKEVKRSCVSIESIRKTDDVKKVEPTNLGSGVMVLKQGIQYCVTNYHVIEPVRSNDILLVGLNMKEGKVYSISKIAAYNHQLDVAVLDIGPALLSKSTTKFDTLNQASVGVSMLADSTYFDEGSSIITIGFPLGIGTDIAGNQPIIRSGIIAQSLRSDATFLVDGIASHGNSGSPVFSLKDGKVLGIVRGFLNDFITAFDENH